jgi:HAD superfamily hydrolase (TIGR01549 family)
VSAIVICQVRAVVFDALNTTITSRRLPNPRHRLAEILGLESERRLRQLMYIICADQPGIAEQAFVETLLAHTGHVGNKMIAAEVSELWGSYHEDLELVEGAHEAIKALRKDNRKLVLISNCTPFFGRVVQRLSLDSLFDTIELSSNVGFLKPDPRIFTRPLQQVGVEPRSSCVVGDQVMTDILGGTLLGTKTILVCEGGEPVTVDDQLPVSGVVAHIRHVPYCLQLIEAHT